LKLSPAIIAVAALSLGAGACSFGEAASAALTSQDCAACHEAQFQVWAESHHALAERVLDPGARTVQDIGPDGQRHDYPALRAIGVSPLVQYVVALDGHEQVSQMAQDTTDGSWFDVFADGRQPGEWGHWTGRGMNWDSMCAGCHNTGVQREWSADRDRFTTAMTEHGVGCTACHRQGADHVKNPGPQELAFDAETCLPCHARRTELQAFQPGMPLLDLALPAMPDLRDHWYPDGQIRAEDFEASSFLLSQMAAAGVTCLDCHEPHSGTLRQEGNALCLSCHDGNGRLPAPVIDPTAHSGHGASSTGNRCISCHMPTTVYMQRHARHDHGFLLPDPALSRELDLPLACDRCHSDREPAWAAAQFPLAPELDARRLHAAARTRAIAAAREGKEQAIALLRVALREETQPAWRGVLFGLIADLAKLPQDWQPQASPDSPNPWERLQAAANPALLQDSLRAVRLQAARQVLPALDSGDAVLEDLTAAIHLHRGQPTGAMEEAQFLFVRGEAEAVLPLTTWAARWETSSPAPFHLQASALDALGRSAEAYALLQHACELFPKDATSYYLLGLAASAEADYPASEKALERALLLQPEYPAAKRNLEALQAFLRRRKPQ